MPFFAQFTSYYYHHFEKSKILLRNHVRHTVDMKSAYYASVLVLSYKRKKNNAAKDICILSFSNENDG
jgi:hypothetical protein